MRTLVVDDNIDTADSLAMLLEVMGIEAVVAYSGKQALERAHTFQPEMALLDIGMPDMSGFALGRLLRAAHPSVVLVALTGWSRQHDRALARDAGFTHYLVKPAAMEDLQRLLKPVG